MQQLLQNCIIPIRNSFDDRYFSDKYQVLPEKGYTAFFEAILDKHKNKTFTVETGLNNYPAVSLYKSYGFKEVEKYIAEGVM